MVQWLCVLFWVGSNVTPCTIMQPFRADMVSLLYSCLIGSVVIRLARRQCSTSDLRIRSPKGYFRSVKLKIAENFKGNHFSCPTGRYFYMGTFHMWILLWYIG